MLLKCWRKALSKLSIQDSFDYTLLHSPLRCRHVEGLGTADDLITLCHYYKVNCKVYVVKQTPEYKYFSQEAFHPPDTLYKKTIHLHTQGDRWCLFYQAKRTVQVKALQRLFCNTCSRWIACDGKKRFLSYHYNYCVQCACGNAYDKRTSSHPNTCNKQKKRIWLCKKKDKDGKKTWEKVPTTCKMFKRDTQPHYLKHNHHADFETIPTGNGRTMVVDSAGLWDDTNNKYLAWCGKDALKDWFDYIVEHLDGTLWFFYGSKFDTHMIFKYMISHGIAVDKEKTMLRGNVIYILGIATKKGTVIIKDLTKFLVGSLDWNCKSFGVAQEHAKTSFDHAKCQSWEDVETYKV